MAGTQEHPSLAIGVGGPITGGTDPFGHPLPPVVTDPLPPFTPLDPDQVAQTEMLNEAVLNSFAADTSPATPLAPNTLRWDITMPTTVIVGVTVDVQLAELVDGSTNPGYADLSPVGTRPAAIRNATTYTLSLVAPKATRVLGSVRIEVDLSTLTSFALSTFLVTAPVKNQLDNGFPAGGMITLRTPPVIGVHLEAITVDLALSVDGPAFYNPDASVSLSWTLSGRGPAWNDPPDADAQILCAISTAQTNVDIGVGLSITSLGVANAVAAAVEGVSNGYLYQLVGPLIAQQLVGDLVDVMNGQRPANTIFHHLDVTPDALTFWYCPEPHAPIPPSHIGIGHGQQLEV